jgi:hypothetical protein
MHDIREEQRDGIDPTEFYPGTESAVLNPDLVRAALTRASRRGAAPAAGDPIQGLRYGLLASAVLWALILLVVRTILSI